MRRTENCYSNRPYERTKKGMCFRAYYHQVKSSKNRGHDRPVHTKEDLMEWMMSQDNFNELYDNWVESNYTTDLKPSCDRLDNSKGYSFDNMELVTFKENKERANIDTINGTLGSSQVEIFQYDLEGNFISRYKSMNDACRSNSKFDQRNISSCCRNKIPTAYGFKWSYNYLGDKIEAIEANTSYLREIFLYNPLTGSIEEVYETILDIPEPEYSRLKVRNVIQGVYSTHNNKYFSFEFLSPEQVVSKVNTKYTPRAIIQMDKDGNELARFKSMSEASIITNVGSGNISKCCNGKAKSAGGFTWKRIY